tara:strand:+ start:64 stop:654 length:591 start_codon:yes stop_codon:yes gene_type:complete
MSKSIAIIGKGPSVLRCTRNFVDSFDEVALCGRPVFQGYEKYIGSRGDYDFANRTSTPYSIEQKEILGIKKTIDTGGNTTIRDNFRYDDLDPSTGILAYDYFVSQEQYTKIAIIGFDLLQTMEKMYYFKNEEFDPAVNWLWHNGTYDYKGRLTIVSGHNTEKTYEYINQTFDKYKNKQFYVISSYPFEKKENVIII